MLTGTARVQLQNILEFLPENDLKVIELKLIPGNPRSNSSAERIYAILSCALQPSEILLQKRMRKSFLRRYLGENGINVMREQPKSDYIRILLNLWEVHDDEFLRRFRIIEENEAVINQFEQRMTEKLRELKRRIRERRPPLHELEGMRRSMDVFLETIDLIGNEQQQPGRPLDDDSDSSSSVEEVVGN